MQKQVIDILAMNMTVKLLQYLATDKVYSIDIPW